MTVSQDIEAEIQRLHEAELWPPGTIASQLGIHHEVVERVLRGRAPARSAKRKSFVDAYVPFMRETLEKYPSLRATRLYDMLKARGFPGEPRTVREHAALLRPRHREAFLRISSLIGEQSQIDWAFVQNVDVDGGKRALWMFIMVLSWSRAMWCELCFGMDAACVARSLVRAGEAFGGVTRQWLFDNPKTIVIDRYENAVRFHPLLLSTTTALRVQPRLCTPRRANEKGKVERAIRFVRERALSAWSFTNLDEGNAYLQRFCDGIARTRPHPTIAGRTVGDCFAEERSKLLALPETLPATHEVRSAVVDKTAFIRFDTNDYSVPHTLVGKTVTVVASDRELRVVDVDVEVARHVRNNGRKRTIEDPAHREALIAQKRAGKQVKRREQLAERFSGFAVLVERWLAEHRNIGNAVGRAERIRVFYGDDIFQEAVDDAVTRNIIDLGAFESICEGIRRRGMKRPSAPPPQHPSDRDVTPHDLEHYDE
jgi:transposase